MELSDTEVNIIFFFFYFSTGRAFWQISPWINTWRVLFCCCSRCKSVAWPTRCMLYISIISFLSRNNFIWVLLNSLICYWVIFLLIDFPTYFLQNQGKDIADSELLDYISESSTMSKSLADYGEQKSCAVTTAKRLADFLGDTMVKDKGLRCQYIVACEPKVHFCQTWNVFKCKSLY